MEAIDEPLWSRSAVLGMAKVSCVHCRGYGLVSTLHKGRIEESPCPCVLREVFRQCYRRFRECVSAQGNTSGVWYGGGGGAPSGRHRYGRKREEFVADFCLLARRMLNDVDFEIFRRHYVLGAEWRQSGVDRGTFFHSVYRIEETLGRYYAEVRPYALYPLFVYFDGKPVGTEAALPLRSSTGLGIERHPR